MKQVLAPASINKSAPTIDERLIDSPTFWKVADAVRNRTYGNLLLNTGGVEQWLDALPQFVPAPGTQFHVLAQVALDYAQGNTLSLDLLELTTSQVTSNP